MLVLPSTIKKMPRRHTLMEFAIIILPGYVISIEGSESHAHNIPYIIELFESWWSIFGSGSITFTLLVFRSDLRKFSHGPGLSVIQRMSDSRPTYLIARSSLPHLVGESGEEPLELIGVLVTEFGENS
jgi:hypothetical protein